MVKLNIYTTLYNIYTNQMLEDDLLSHFGVLYKGLFEGENKIFFQNENHECVHNTLVVK